MVGLNGAPGLPVACPVGVLGPPQETGPVLIPHRPMGVIHALLASPLRRVKSAGILNVQVRY